MATVTLLLSHSSATWLLLLLLPLLFSPTFSAVRRPPTSSLREEPLEEEPAFSLGEELTSLLREEETFSSLQENPAAAARDDPSLSNLVEQQPLAPEPFSDPLEEQPFSDPLEEQPFSDPLEEQPFSDPLDEEPFSDPLDGEPFSDPLEEQPFSNPLNGEASAIDDTRRRVTEQTPAPSKTITPKVEGNVRLMGGKTSAEGNVEIFHMGRWGGVCDDEWDMSEATVVCRQLGFSAAVRATHDSEYGIGKKRFWMDNVMCEGDEPLLSACRTDGWGSHDCNLRESAGVVCMMEANTPPAPPQRPLGKQPRKKLKDVVKNMEVRLSGGREATEGRLEVRVNDHWGLVCGDGWDIFDAIVVCRQLGHHYAQSAVQTTFFGGDIGDVILSEVHCHGNESSLSECYHGQFGDVFCPGQENIAGIICADELSDLEIDAPILEQSVYLEDRQLYLLQCAMEENCVASEAYTEEFRADYNWLYKTRRLLRFTSRIINVGNADFLPFQQKHLWEWHQCHMHYHSMEVFTHYDITDPKTGVRVAEGHKASFCLEDNSCSEGVTPSYACEDYGDQGISPGCADTYLHNIDCQWIDITGVKPGVYIFRVSINPEYKVAEQSFDNNVATCELTYTGYHVAARNCYLSRP